VLGRHQRPKTHQSGVGRVCIRVDLSVESRLEQLTGYGAERSAGSPGANQQTLAKRIRYTDVEATAKHCARRWLDISHT